MMARASLTTGPCAGRTMEIAQEVYDRGTLHIMGDPDPAEEWSAEECGPVKAGRLPVHEYRRVTMASGPLSDPATRVWEEWHHVPPRKAGPHGRED